MLVSSLNLIKNFYCRHSHSHLKNLPKKLMLNASQSVFKTKKTNVLIAGFEIKLCLKPVCMDSHDNLENEKEKKKTSSQVNLSQRVD